ncbi:DUF992 domain-containing protein [Bradyrhizobium sp.]|uniref:DUF992 domain-containing protein n=1 Tax=Bradyrhizobium sp. TaxID=376 RepID=UPI003C4BAF1B
MRLPSLLIATAALVGSFANANATPPAPSGILHCEGGQNVGFVVGSVASLECVFRSEGHRPEAYLATVRRFGLDLGVTQQTRFTWEVNAPTPGLVKPRLVKHGRGELAGSYGGIGANASVGVGGGGNFLVGGPANAYALQPISTQGQTGVNLAAGVADLELQPVHLVHADRRLHHRPPGNRG